MESTQSTKLTISDIAKMAKTSTMTVSRVLNDRPDVSKKTRERVLEIIHESGYRPHAFARGLSGGKTNIVGVALYTGGEPVGSFYVEVLQGLQLGLAEQNRDLLFFAPSKSDTYYERVLETSIIEGLVLMGHVMTDKEMDQIHSLSLPVVTIGRRTHDSITLPFVSPNYHDALFRIMSHLVLQGARCISPVIISLSEQNMGFAPNADRLAGVRDAVEQYGLDPAAMTPVQATASFQDGYEYVNHLRELPDAFILDHSDFSFGIAMGLRDRQISPQKDVLLAAVDLDRTVERCEHVLNTVIPKWHVPWAEIGRRAIRVLDQQNSDADPALRAGYVDFISPL